MVLLTLLRPTSFSYLQAVLGGSGPLLWLGLQAAQVHHPGRQLQHEPVEAEHHCLSCKRNLAAVFTVENTSVFTWLKFSGTLLMSPITCPRDLQHPLFFIYSAQNIGAIV